MRLTDWWGGQTATDITTQRGEEETISPNEEWWHKFSVNAPSTFFSLHMVSSDGIAVEIIQLASAVDLSLVRPAITLPDGNYILRVATPHGVGKLNVNDVPLHAARFDLRLNFSQTARVVLGQDVDAGLFGERLMISFDLRLGVSPAPRHNGQTFGGRSRRCCHCTQDERTRRSERRHFQFECHS